MKRRPLAALAVLFTWALALFCNAQPVRGEQAVEEILAGVRFDPRADVRLQRQLTEKQAPVSLAKDEPASPQYRHEHDRVSLPSETRERPRTGMASRSGYRRAYEDLVPESFRPLLTEVAAQFDLDPRLVAAVITVESQWNVRTLGTHQDAGLMQIIPPTAEWIAESMGLKDYDIFDPRTNLTMGCWYLHVLIKEYNSVPMALAAYNGGPRMAQYGETYRYTQWVMGIYESQGKY